LCSVRWQSTALTCGDLWALPAAKVVASFVAQTHVGFLPLAIALLACGVGCLAVRTLGSQDGAPSWRRLARSGAISAAVLAVLWLPPAVDVLVNAPSNAGNILRYFRTAEESAHGLDVGWRVVSGQFALAPEWLVTKHASSWGAESPFRETAPLPLALLVVGVAAVALWHWNPSAGRWLLATLGVTLAASVVAVSRTAGPVYDYRLRWTWVAPMVTFVAVLWVGWLALYRRWRGAAERRVLPLAVVGLVVLAGVDAVAGGRARLDHEDSEIMAELTPQVLDALEQEGGVDEVGDFEGQVLVVDDYNIRHANGLIVQLARRDVDVRVLPERGVQLGDSHVVDASPATQLIVTQDHNFFHRLDDPAMELVAVWSTYERAEWDDLRAELAAIDQFGVDLREGRIGVEEYDGLVATTKPKHKGDMALSIVGVFRPTGSMPASP
jgi:hypothetical protein